MKNIGLFTKKSKQGGWGSGTLWMWNFDGYQISSIWNFEGLTKMKWNFQG